MFKRLFAGTETNRTVYLSEQEDVFPDDAREGAVVLCFSPDNATIKAFRRESGDWKRYFFDKKGLVPVELQEEATK